jgi:hypothetical protein
MTPAYPKLKPSYVEKVSVTTLKLFNRREDVNYYEIEVFTGEWKPVPFATKSKVIKVNLNKTKSFDVYIRSVDIKKVVYICTVSKLHPGKKQITLVSSRICSKIK